MGGPAEWEGGAYTSRAPALARICIWLVVHVPGRAGARSAGLSCPAGHAMMGYWSGIMPGASAGLSCPLTWHGGPVGSTSGHACLAPVPPSPPGSLPHRLQAPGVAKYHPRLMYPLPSPGTLEVDPSMQAGHSAAPAVAWRACAVLGALTRTFSQAG